MGCTDPEDLRPVGLVNKFKSGLIKGICLPGSRMEGVLCPHAGSIPCLSALCLWLTQPQPALRERERERGNEGERERGWQRLCRGGGKGGRKGR